MVFLDGLTNRDGVTRTVRNAGESNSPIVSESSAGICASVEPVVVVVRVSPGAEKIIAASRGNHFIEIGGVTGVTRLDWRRVLIRRTSENRKLRRCHRIVSRRLRCNWNAVRAGRTCARFVIVGLEKRSLVEIGQQGYEARM